MWISYFYDYAISRFNVGQLYVRINSSKTSKTCNNDFGGRNVCEYRCQYRCLISMRMKEDAGKVITVVFIIFIFAFLGYEHVIANFPAFTLAYFASHGQMDGMTASNVLHNLFLLWQGIILVAV